MKSHLSLLKYTSTIHVILNCPSEQLVIKGISIKKWQISHYLENKEDNALHDLNLGV